MKDFSKNPGNPGMSGNPGNSGIAGGKGNSVVKRAFFDEKRGGTSTGAGRTRVFF